MKDLDITVLCKAVYDGTIQVPDNMNLKDAIAYAKEHLDEIPANDLEWVSDLEIDEEFCRFHSEENDSSVIGDRPEPAVSQGRCDQSTVVSVNSGVSVFLSEEELSLLSDGLLALIENNNRAMQIVRYEQAQRELKNHSGQLAKLNGKICNAMDHLDM